MRHADQPREDPSQLTRAEKTALSLGDE